MQRVVITGGTGMLGRALTRDLLSQGCQVLLLVNPGSARANDLASGPSLTVVPCDIAAFPSLAVPEGPAYDTFFHLGWGGTFGGARDDMAAQAANIRFALDAVDLAARLGCSTFVGAGSQAEYGRADGALMPTTPTNPESGYGIAKLAAGSMTRLRCSQLGLCHRWARILSVYGPHDGARTMVMSTITTLLDGQVPRFTPCGQQWDYLYCDDAAAALRLIGERGRDDAVYCIGSGDACPLSSYVTRIRDAVDPALPLAIGALPYNDRQVMYLRADITALRKDTGFEPLVGFEQGIAETVAWVKDRRYRR